MLAIMWIFRRRNPHKVSRGFRLAQTVSAAALALGHGLQDAQKTMGVIFLALVTGGYARPTTDLPLWVIVCRGRRDLAGHLLRRLADHAHPRPQDHPPRPAAGLRRRDRSARASSTRRRSSSQAPISTTHMITSAIMGAGATKRFSRRRWGVARIDRRSAWVLTFPAAGSRRGPGLRACCTSVFRLP